jgi:hypothetical protein
MISIIMPDLFVLCYHFCTAVGGRQSVVLVVPTVSCVYDLSPDHFCTAVGGRQSVVLVVPTVSCVDDLSRSFLYCCRGQAVSSTGSSNCELCFPGFHIKNHWGDIMPIFFTGLVARTSRIRTWALLQNHQFCETSSSKPLTWLNLPDAQDSSQCSI